MSSNSPSPKANEPKSDVLSRLEAAEAALKERDAEINQLRDEAARVAATGGLKYSPSDRPYAGPGGGFEFTVTPILREGETEFAHLTPKTVRACDESEALRWYCQAHEMKPGSGKAVDPVRVRLTVACLGRERADAIMRQKQISALRRKVEAGVQLTEADNALLAQCEGEIYGYGS